MSRSSNSIAAAAVIGLVALLGLTPVGAQTPNPPGGGSGGGGTGCTTAGSNGDLLTDDGAGGCNSDGNATLTAGALALGSSGVNGSVAFGNATTGTITLQPVTGALGAVTAVLPANSGTLAELNLAQSWSAVQTFGNGDLVLSGSGSGSSTLQAPATGGGTLTLPAGTDTIAAIAASQTLTNKAISGVSNTLSNIENSSLTNSSTTVNGQTCVLGSTCTVTAAATGVTVGTTTITSGTTNGLLYDSAGVLGNIATINSGVLVTSGVGAPSISTTLPNGLALGTPGSVTLTNATGLPVGGMASVAANTFVANVTGSGALPTAASLPSCSTTSSALQYASGTGLSCGTSFVTGPASVTSGHIATFNGTSGKILQDGGALPTGTVSSVTCFGVAITTSGTCTTTGQLPGASTNTIPSAGNIGEAVTSSVLLAGEVSLTTNVIATVTSISLTAGSWTICGTVYFDPNAATVTTQSVGAFNNTTSLPVAGALGSQTNIWFGSQTGPLPTASLGCSIVHLSSGATYNLLARAIFTVNTNAAYGKIEAWRIN